MKKNLLLLGFLLLSFSSFAQTKNPFYYELITNDTKTINFVFGFYPTTYTYTESAGQDPFTSIKGAVINNAKSSYEWKDYKICILLKSGKLIRSYTTVAKDGDYDCTYSAGAGQTHYQYFCFHTKFSDKDVDKVWLVMGDDQIFALVYDKNE